MRQLLIQASPRSWALRPMSNICQDADALFGMSFLDQMDVRLYKGAMTIRQVDCHEPRAW